MLDSLCNPEQPIRDDDEPSVPDTELKSVQFDTNWTAMLEDALSVANRVGDIDGRGNNMTTDCSQKTSLTCLHEQPCSRVLDFIKCTGFETFDDLVVTYYVTSFGSLSNLSNMQRLSRSRRLPTVFSRIFDATKSWNAWECRGLHDEILRAAENMLETESKQLQDVSSSNMDFILSFCPSTDIFLANQANPALKSLISTTVSVRCEIFLGRLMVKDLLTRSRLQIFGHS